MLKFTKASEFNRSNGIKSIVYGDSGMGKTVIMATAPRPLMIAAEPGVLSLQRKDLEVLYGVGNENITYDMPIIEVHSVQDLLEAYNWCLSSAEASAFDTICIDSLTEVGEVVLCDAKLKAGKDGRQGYYKMLDIMTDVVKKFRDLKGKHVVMSAKIESYKDELYGGIKYGPAMPGQKLGMQIPYWFDGVYRLGILKDEKGNSHRFLQTQPDYDLQYQAQNRGSALEPIEKPDLTYIFDKILHSKKLEQE